MLCMSRRISSLRIYLLDYRARLWSRTIYISPRLPDMQKPTFPESCRYLCSRGDATKSSGDEKFAVELYAEFRDKRRRLELQIISTHLVDPEKVILKSIEV